MEVGVIVAKVDPTDPQPSAFNFLRNYLQLSMHPRRILVYQHVSSPV